MDVADLRDAETLKAFGEIADQNRAADDFQLVASVGCRVECQPGGRQGGRAQEYSARDAVGFRVQFAGH